MPIKDETIQIAECDGCGEKFPLTAVRVIWLKAETSEGKLISMNKGENEKGFVGCPKCLLELLGLKAAKLSVIKIDDNWKEIKDN